MPTDGKELLSKVKMPNRDGFIPEQVFKLDNEPEASPTAAVPRKVSRGAKPNQLLQSGV